MAWTLTVNFVNDALNAESKDAFAVQYKWTATIADPASTPSVTLPNIPNPVSKAQFRDQCVKKFVKDCVAWYRTDTAEKAIVVVAVPD